ncbi:MAG: hypothetical protein CFE29_03635 [Bradyrhizobiaceae bacterium PARB1]|nr:MAG: hypothetical protein CFE29_03635 [Bradyrhizobiaceae bacterium PARB1]
MDAKNVSPIDISEDIASVDQAIREVDDAETAAEQLKLPASYAALARIFALILKIVAAMPLQHFCVMMGIEIHGNTKNNLQPIVAWLWRTYKSEYVRQVVWRWSAVLAVALEGGVPVEEFPQWIEKNGIGPMVRLHQERKKQTVPAADAAAEEIIAQGMCAQGEDAPRLSATQLTRNEDMGRHIAVIEIHPQGEFQLLTLLPATPEQIRRMLVNLARKRQSRGA